MTIKIKVRESGQTGREKDLEENNKYEKETSLAEKGRACELQGREVDGCRGHRPRLFASVCHPQPVCVFVDHVGVYRCC